MVYKYTVKQGGTQIYGGTTTTDNFSYDFPENTGTTDIVYTIDVEDDNGCSATTSVTVPSDSECQESDVEKYIILSVEGEGGSLNGGRVAVDFACDELVRYDLGDSNNYKLVAPKGCSFSDIYGIWFEIMPGVECSEMTKDGFISVPFEDIFDYMTFTFAFKQTKAKINCNINLEYGGFETGNNATTSKDLLISYNFMGSGENPCGVFNDTLANGDYISCIADISVNAVYIDETYHEYPALDINYNYSNVEIKYTAQSGTDEIGYTSVGGSLKIDDIPYYVSKTMPNGVDYAFRLKEFNTFSYQIKSIYGQGRKYTYYG